MIQPVQPIRLHAFVLSGHSHRAELLLRMLDLPFERIEVDLVAGQQRRPDFLAKNPLGEVPVIEDGDVTLPDSNAILVYLATRYDPSGRWLPRDAAAAGQVQRWLSAAAGPLYLGPARARVAHVFKAKVDLEHAYAMAGKILNVLERSLTGRSFLVGEAPTIADVAMYTYTAHAPEGGISLDPFEHVRAWLARVESLPRFSPMRRSPTPPR
jgi:glutathione S-transferase